MWRGRTGAFQKLRWWTVAGLRLCRHRPAAKAGNRLLLRCNKRMRSQLASRRQLALCWTGEVACAADVDRARAAHIAVGCTMKLSYGWVVVGAGMLMTCIGVGAIFSLAVFLQPIAADTGWSRGHIDGRDSYFLCGRGFVPVGRSVRSFRYAWSFCSAAFCSAGPTLRAARRHCWSSSFCSAPRSAQPSAAFMRR